MLHIMFFTLLAAGGISLLGSKRTTKFIGFLQPIFFLVLAYMLYNGYDSFEEYKISWIKLPKMKLSLNLSATSILWQELLMPFILVGLAIFNNYFLPSNKKNAKYNGVLFFILAGFILLLSATNFMQFILGVEIISLSAFYLTEDSDKNTYYVGITILSDVALLAGFSLLYGQFDSMKLQNIMYFSQKFQHQSLISGLFLFAVLAKSGLFLFNSELLSLQNLDLERIITIILTSTPLVSMIIFIKTFPIIKLFPYFDILFNVLLFVSIIVGGVFFIIKDSLKSKSIYLYMIFSAIIFIALKQDISKANHIMIAFYTPLYMFLLLFQSAAISSSNEVRVSQMGGFIEKLSASFFLFLLSVFVVICSVSNIFNGVNTIFAYTGIIILFLCLSNLQHEIYISPSRGDERVVALLKNPPMWYTVSLFCIGIIALHTWGKSSQIVAILFIVYCLCTMFLSSKYIRNMIIDISSQEKYLLEEIYKTIFIIPLKIIGRVLWLTVDFIFIERTIFSSIQKVYKFLLHISTILSSVNIVIYLTLALLGLMLSLLIIGGYL